MGLGQINEPCRFAVGSAQQNHASVSLGTGRRFEKGTTVGNWRRASSLRADAFCLMR